MRRSGRVLAAAALCGAVLLGGCDGAEDPPTTPATSESPTSEEPTTEETSPAPTPPEVDTPTPAPEAATDDHVGAIWAARYFLDLYTYMRATGDTGPFEAMSAAECQFCASQAAAARERHEEGGWIEGGELEFDIHEATAEYPTADEPNYLVRFDMIEADMVVHGGDGSADPSDGAEYRVVIALQFINGRFVVFGVNAE